MKNYFNLLIFACLLLCATGLLAQVKKGFKMLEKKNYTAAHEAFLAETDTSLNGIAAQYGILYVYANQKDSLSLWLQGLEVWQQLSGRFKALKQADKKKIEEFVNQSKISSVHKSLCGKAITYLEKNGSKEKLEQFYAVTPQPAVAYLSRLNKLKEKFGLSAQETDKDNAMTFSDQTEEEDETEQLLQPPVYVERNIPADMNMQFVKGINTAYSEIVPIVSADGKTLYFTSSNRVDRMGGEDIFYCELQPDGTWSSPKLHEELSDYSNEAVVSVTADGNALILFINGRLHTANRTTTGWSAPKPVNLPNVFTWVGIASISRNGEVLLLEASYSQFQFLDKGSDMYVSIKQKDGTWGEAQKLNGINTEEDERAPFLHSDFKTLYFSTSGLGGEGGLDIFKTTRLDDSWLNWSEPVNLGKTINTSGDDWGFFIPPAGEYAYMSTVLPGYNDGDLVKVALPKEIQPEKQKVVTGALLNAEGKGVQADITIENARTGQVLQKLKSRPDGKYTFVVPEKAQINFSAKAQGMLPTTKYLDLSKQTTADLVEQPMQMVSYKDAEKGAALTLGSVFFDFAKYDLRPESESELRRIYTELTDLGWTVEIGGHTDNIGSDEFNANLSQQRAEEVRKFLLQQGLPAGKVSAKGYGRKQPIADNDTDEGRSQNRRVEIKIKNK
ncbi:hypothetical protein C7N43_27255 [Sphingobacteriales bacterium UPWRP_1]|nr:hypothetical protein C7N43_27255 [Sphingobacteriales bacterium UPWRP_1]